MRCSVTAKSEVRFGSEQIFPPPHRCDFAFQACSTSDLTMAGSFFSGFSYSEGHLLDMILQLCLCDLVMCIVGYLGHVPRLREQWTCRIDTAFLILHILELVVPVKWRSTGGTETKRGGQERSSKTMLKRTPVSSLGTEENGGWYSRRLLYFSPFFWKS